MNTKMFDKLLNEFVDCHTVILHGSRVNDSHTPESDIDVVCFREKSENYTDARLWGGMYLDAWIYDDSEMKNINNFVYLFSGKILKDEKGLGKKFLNRVKKYYNSGPKKLSENEKEHLKVWSLKTLKRAYRQDFEGNYRKIWLAKDLLEMYFNIRNKWFLGSKKSILYLEKNDPETFSLFDKMYKSDCDLELIKLIIDKVFNQDISNLKNI